MIPEVREQLCCYHWVYISLYFIEEDGLDKREEKVGVEPYLDEEDTKDVVLDDQRERHWRMVFQDNNGGVDGTKALLHANKWDVYNSDNEASVKGGYLVEVSDKERKKIIWEVVDDHVVEVIDQNYRVITLILKKCGNLPLCLENDVLFSLPPILQIFYIHIH